ncbi:MAG: hypothetical protein M3R24_39665 [Chloroflexota bacterium]|nr:hypothetical protein [Chloroflexota bacterium]
MTVTWDNPDVRLEHNGVAVPSYNLQPNTTYDVIAQIWNGSVDAPVVGMPVHMSYLTFGIGTTKTLIGTTTVDVGVKGSQHAPGYARLPWTTPEAGGHYCLQIELDWPDDANPRNNLGQHNTDVKALNSPRATFEFEVHNPGSQGLNYRLIADDYRLLDQDCSDAPSATPEQSTQERQQRLRRTHRLYGWGRFSQPLDWQIIIEPTTFWLAPDETVKVIVVAIAPEGFAGRQPINIHAFTGDTLVGGVTLYAEGKV